MRDRYHSLLQILGCVAVIAFHGQFPGSGFGWAAVELFFGLAGYNMFRSAKSTPAVAPFFARRYIRLAAPVFLILPIAGYLVVAHGLKLAKSFLVFGPMMLQNVLPLAGADWKGGDVVWIPLWFLAALFQLQLLAFIFQKPITRARVEAVLLGAIVVGFAGRVILWKLFTSGSDSLSLEEASVVFWAPFSHVEVFVWGCLLAQGRLRLGRYLGWIVAGTVIIGIWSARLRGSDARALGFPAGLPLHLQFIWGYPVIALLMDAWVDPQNRIAERIRRLNLPVRVDRTIDYLSRRTLYAYAIHGTVFLVLWNVVSPKTLFFVHHPPAYELLTTAACVVGAFGGAALIHETAVRLGSAVRRHVSSAS